MKSREFEIDSARYLWTDTEGIEDKYTYPQDYDFGLGKEGNNQLRDGSLAIKIDLELQKVENKLISNFFELPNLLQQTPKTAQLMAKRFALSRLKFAIFTPRTTTDELNSDASISGAQRWWEVLDGVQNNDWSVMVGELKKEAREGYCLVKKYGNVNDFWLIKRSEALKNVAHYLQLGNQ